MLKHKVLDRGALCFILKARTETGGGESLHSWLLMISTFVPIALVEWEN